MDIAYSYPDNQGSDQESTKALDELNALLDREDVSLLDRVKSPGKTAAQIRQSKANKRTEETTQQEHAERVRQLDEWRVRESSRHEQERADLRAVAQWIEAGAKQQKTPDAVWLEKSGVLALVGARSSKLCRVLDSPSDYHWLDELNLRKPNPSRKNGWLFNYFGLLEKLRTSGDFYGDIPDPNQEQPKPDPMDSSLRAQLVFANGKTQKAR